MSGFQSQGELLGSGARGVTRKGIGGGQYRVGIRDGLQYPFGARNSGGLGASGSPIAIGKFKDRASCTDSTSVKALSQWIGLDNRGGFSFSRLISRSPVSNFPLSLAPRDEHSFELIIGLWRDRAGHHPSEFDVDEMIGCCAYLSGISADRLNRYTHGQVTHRGTYLPSAGTHSHPMAVQHGSMETSPMGLSLQVAMDMETIYACNCRQLLPHCPRYPVP